VCVCVFEKSTITEIKAKRIMLKAFQQNQGKH